MSSAQRERELEEMRRADAEPRPAWGRPGPRSVTGGQLIEVDFSPGAVLEALRAKQEQGGARFQPTAAEMQRARDLDDPEAARRMRRRNNLISAGVERPVAKPQQEAWDRVTSARSAAEASVPGHTGSLRAMRTVARWLSGREPWATLVLSGPPGTGKTVAGWCALASVGGLYVSASAAAPSSRWDAVKERAKGARLVVLNDVTERLSDTQRGLVLDLFEDRHDCGMHTLVTTNMERDTLIRWGGARLDSRIGPDSGEGQGAVVPVDGADLRKGAR